MLADATIAPSGKACKKCGAVRPMTSFPKCDAARDGRAGRCFSCAHAARAQNPDYREYLNAKGKAWKKSNRDRNRALKKAEGVRRRIRHAEQTGREYIPLALRIEDAHRRRSEEKAQRQAEREATRKPWNDPGLSPSDQRRVRYRLDPEFNLRERIKASMKRKVRGKVGDLLREALKRDGQSPTAKALVGYDVATLRAHLERQFTKGMSWERFCAGDIHIDHIIPLASFDLSRPEEMRAAWALPNLRPLWAEENGAKAAKRLHLV